MAEIDWRRWYDLARTEAEHERVMKEHYRRWSGRWRLAFWLIVTLHALVTLARLLAWAAG